jgi:hypothetical protein
MKSKSFYSNKSFYPTDSEGKIIKKTKKNCNFFFDLCKELKTTVFLFDSSYRVVFDEVLKSFPCILRSACQFDLLERTVKVSDVCDIKTKYGFIWDQYGHCPMKLKFVLHLCDDNDLSVINCSYVSCLFHAYLSAVIAFGWLTNAMERGIFDFVSEENFKQEMMESLPFFDLTIFNTPVVSINVKIRERKLSTFAVERDVRIKMSVGDQISRRFDADVIHFTEGTLFEGFVLPYDSEIR